MKGFLIITGLILTLLSIYTIKLALAKPKEYQSKGIVLTIFGFIIFCLGVFIDYI